MTQEYFLKHKDHPVLLFELNMEKYVPVEIKKLFDKERLPFILDNDTDINLFLGLLTLWIQNRGITESRDDYEKLMEENHSSNGRELSINSLGLNLTDHYWMHNSNQNLSWKKLNFFDHKFKKKIQERIYPSGEKVPVVLHPDFNIDGCVIKTWVTDGKDRVLLKEGRINGIGQEPYNEVIATKIMDLLGISNVGYSLRNLENKVVCACKCMVDRNTELYYAKNILEINQNPHENYYFKYRDFCKNKGLIDIQKSLDEMVVIDFIMGNFDRHSRNFGIIRDAETLKWIKTAPIYDCGNSLFFMQKPYNKLELNIDSYCKWTKSNNGDLLQNIKTFEWYNETALKKIPDIIYNGLKDINWLKMDENRLSIITDIANLRVKKLIHIFNR